MNTPDCLLDCGHWKRIRIDLAVYGAVETCAYCGPDMVVVRINYHEYHARCIVGGCRYGRWFGQNQELAKQSRQRHLTKHPTHSASVAWDTVTWDGKGSVFREEVDRLTPAKRPKAPPEFTGQLRLDLAPPF